MAGLILTLAGSLAACSTTSTDPSSQPPVPTTNPAVEQARRDAAFAVALAQAEAQRQAAAAEAARMAPHQMTGPAHHWRCNPFRPDYRECDQARVDAISREVLREYPNPTPAGPRVPSWQPSSPRPIQPYWAAPGDPNDRDHDGRACESGCIN